MVVVGSVFRYGVLVSDVDVVVYGFSRFVSVV